MFKFLRLLHIYASMAVVVALLFYAVTGITLNHPEWQSTAGQQSQSLQLQLPAELQALNFGEDQLQNAAAAAQIADWLRATQQVKGAVFNFNYDGEAQLLELDFKRPAGFSNAEIALTTGTVQFNSEYAGVLALLNDLHKGRYAGTSWRWFSDAIAIACVLFAMSGFYLLWRQNSRRWHGVATAVVGFLVLLLAYALALH
jgi:hypothetical protein